MTKKKNGFLTLCFSLIPGAGEMYMGFMKMGVSLMSMAILDFILFYCFGLDMFLFVGVVIWFYSFFHTHNIRSMDDESFYALEDTYLFPMAALELVSDEMEGKYRKVAGVVCIFLGAFLLWRNFWNVIADLMPAIVRQVVRGLNRNIPQFVLGAVIIWAGVAMIRGKKKELLDGEADAAEAKVEEAETETEVAETKEKEAEIKPDSAETEEADTKAGETEG